MQIILLEKVVNVGDLGEVVRVKDGFARNFLIPQKKARRATEKALKEFEERRAELERLQAEKLAKAQAVGEKLKDYVLVISQKAGVDGRLFGSVTNMDIATALTEKGFEGVNKSQIRMTEGAIKVIGDHGLQVSLHADVLCDITVKVEGALG
ncbi:MAG: 50S ribosomal protein L9 [Orrella sp.]